METQRAGAATPPRSTLRTAKVLVAIVILGTFGRGSAQVWPLLAWPMYHDRGTAAAPEMLSSVEVRALDSNGDLVGVLKTSDVFGFERVPAGSAYLTATFGPIDGDDRADRIDFLAARAESIFDHDDVEVLQGWRVTWEVDSGTVPPLVRDEFVSEELIDSHARGAGEAAP